MRKRQLTSDLEKFPDNIEVLQSKDPEGTSYSTVSGFTIGYVDDTYNAGTTDEVFEAEDVEVDGEIPENFRKVLVIWPDS